MPDRKAPLIQVSTMAPFVRAVTEAGLPAGALSASVGITSEMLNDPQSVAPAQSIYRFTELAAKELGEPNLGVKLGLDPAIMDWPVIAEAYSDSHVMVEFFTRFLLDAQKFTTNVAFRLKIGSGVTWFERDRGFVPMEPPAQIDAFALGLFVTLFRVALGDAWRSSDMVFKICDPEVARVPEIGNCNLLRGDPRELSFSFPSEWLVLPIQRHPHAIPDRNAQKPPTEALIAAIRSNIRSNISDPAFGVPQLVSQMGFNRRDVQKYLRDRGSGLADLIEDERKQLACDLLERGAPKLEDVAQALGYTDVSNFSRAFRRWTGVAPSRWRDGKGGEA